MARPDDDDKETTATPPAKRGKMVNILIIVAIVVVVAGAAVAATLMFARGGGEKAGKGTAETAKAEHAPEPRVPLYLDLEPPFVVNLNEEHEIHFLQVMASVMTYDQSKIEKIKGQMPLIRHHLVLLFSSQTFADLRSREGKLKLQEEARDVVREALTSATGDPLIENLYLTSAVAQ